MGREVPKVAPARCCICPEPLEIQQVVTNQRQIETKRLY